MQSSIACKQYLTLTLLTFSLSFSGCPSQQNSNRAKPAETSSSRKQTVVVTTGMVQDLVEHVAQDHMNVIGLMGEGVDPHLYRPTSNDIGKMMNADLIIYSGLMLEGPMQPQFEMARKKGRTVIAVADAVPKENVHFPAGFDDHPDPHLWGNVKLWSSTLDHITKTLGEADPDHAAVYQNYSDSYKSELNEIHEYAKTAISTIPESQRYLVTAHDAFEYFAEAYGIKVRSVQGISTESEPGVQDINELVDFLVEKKIPAIFVEATVNAANIQAVIEGAKQKGWEVKIGGTLFSDSLGTPGTYKGTYIGMMDSNVTTIVKALGGKVPEKGLNGKL